MALIGGITHSNIQVPNLMKFFKTNPPKNIQRLGQTQSLISADVSAQLNEFTELLSFSSNYGKYRQNLREAGRFRIPIMFVDY